ncbi:hypothetical protein FHU13_002570 [Methylobacterium sp. R2-1]|nr:hypothetical protein [Methylobacterium sp. R2-1]
MRKRVGRWGMHGSFAVGPRHPRKQRSALRASRARLMRPRGRRLVQGRSHPSRPCSDPRRPPRDQYTRQRPAGARRRGIRGSPAPRSPRGLARPWLRRRWGRGMGLAAPPSKSGRRGVSFARLSRYATWLSRRMTATG